jgi:hypothetical protein
VPTVFGTPLRAIRANAGPMRENLPTRSTWHVSIDAIQAGPVPPSFAEWFSFFWDLSVEGGLCTATQQWIKKAPVGH